LDLHAGGDKELKIVWDVEPQDIEKTQRFFELHRDDPFVQERIQRNLSGNKPTVSRRYFWYVLVGCLLTTQQRSDPNSPFTV